MPYSRVLFQGVIRSHFVTIKKSRNHFWSVFVSTPDMEHVTRINAYVPEILRDKLVERGIVSEDTAGEIMGKILELQTPGKRMSADAKP